MNLSRMATIVACLLLIPGCGGESTHERMMRMAQNRSKIRAAEEELEQASTAAVQPAPEAVPEPVPPAELKSDPQSDPQPVIAERNPTPVAEPTVAANAPPPVVATGKQRDEEAYPVAPVAVAPSSTEAKMPEMLLRFTPGAQQAVYVGERESIGIFDIGGQRLARQIYNPELKPISLAIGNQGNLLVAGGQDGHLKIFSLGSVSSFDKLQQHRLMRRDAMPPRNIRAGRPAARRYPAATCDNWWPWAQ